VNECIELTTDPCKNGGTCINIRGDFQCLCPPEWTGKVCTDGNICLSILVHETCSLRNFSNVHVCYKSAKYNLFIHL